MLYLSKGLPRRCFGGALTVLHCGVEFELTGEKAQVWVKGRCGCQETFSKDQFTALREITEQGLAETSLETGHESFYRLLTNCIICPARSWGLTVSWSPLERIVWEWLTKAGLRLTMAELVYLVEKDIRPSANLVGQANRQALTETIYTKETILDGILESRMEQSPARDKTVKAVLSLLGKKKVILV